MEVFDTMSLLITMILQKKSVKMVLYISEKIHWKMIVLKCLVNIRFSAQERLTFFLVLLVYDIIVMAIIANSDE